MATEFRLPELGENVTSATIGKVLVNAGDHVAINQPILEIETDKAVAEIPSTIAGVVAEVRVKEGQTVKAGQVVLVIDESAAGAPPSASPPAKTAPAPVSTPAPAPKSAAPVRIPGRAVSAAPSVRRLAREMGVDLSAVPTADPSGRVTAQDVMSFAQAKSTPVTSDPAAAPEGLETGIDTFGPVAFQPMNAVRRKTAEHMRHAWTTIPHVTHFEKADITDLEALRKKWGKQVEAAGGRLTVLSFVLKVLVEAFKRFPKFNASLDLENQRLILKQYYHIGVAVDTPNGLLVPVLRDVNRKSITEISIELPQLAEKARARKLAIEDMQGGTFTITNLGGLGGVGFTPIINAPEVAILGMSRSSTEAVFRDGQFIPRTILPLSLSYDHRIIDGADAARFMRFVAEALEQPWTMFLVK